MEQKGEMLYSPAKLAVYKARKQLLYIIEGTPLTKLPSPKKPFTSFATQSHSQTGIFEFSGCTNKECGKSKIPRLLINANKTSMRLAQHQLTFKRRVSVKKAKAKENKFLQGVRLNRRFDLLMEFRHRNQNF